MAVDHEKAWETTHSSGLLHLDNARCDDIAVVNLLRRLRLRIGRPKAPDVRVAYRFSGIRPTINDCVGFVVGEADPPQSSWPFAELRHLGVEQCDEFFCIPSDEETQDHWGAAMWILPLKESPLGLQPVSVWRGDALDALGFSLQTPSWPGSRWYTRGQVTVLLKCVREFGRVLADSAQLRLNAAAATLEEVEKALPRELESWIVD